MAYALRKEGWRDSMRHAPLHERLRGLYDHYEASYYDFVVSLTKDHPSTEELLMSLLKFRVFKNAFYSEMAKRSAENTVTYLDDGEKHFHIAREARAMLVDAFPEHSAVLDKALRSPIAFLPFIKVSENPFGDVLGHTMKLGPEYGMITVKSGSGRELPTTMHEHLHAAVRGLPGVFEEGFCRYALQIRGFEESELIYLPSHGRDMVMANFTQIYFPNLLVTMLAQASGDRAVSAAFFSQDASGPDELARKASGKGLDEMEAIFRGNRTKDAVEAIAALAQGLRSGISSWLEEMAGMLAGPAAAWKVSNGVKAEDGRF